MRCIVLIPSRLNSSRLPNKPLADIGGKPMILRVWEQAISSKFRVVVACDCESIQNVIIAAGGEAVLTDPSLASGSDRIWQALQKIDHVAEYDYIINLQGDLPNIDPELIVSVLEPLKHGYDMATLSFPIDSCEAARPQVVKIAMTCANQSVRKALYFSRQPIPTNGPYHHHIGIYAYTKAALEAFIKAPPSALENSENLEQLRALEIGLNIGVTTSKSLPVGVDTMEDLEHVRMLRQKSL